MPIERRSSMDGLANVALSFFAYGLFRPGQLAFFQLRDPVVNKIDPAKIPGTLLLRDGLPIIDLTGDGLVTGALLRGGAGPWEGGKIAEGAAADLPGRTAGGTARRRLVVFFAEAVPHV